MSKILISIFFITLNLSVIFYPTKKENTNIFNYCYAFEKILSSNSISKRESLSESTTMISSHLANLGVSKTKGKLIIKIISQYKTYKDNFLINIFPNQMYCLAGYWIEKINPGRIEEIFFEKSKNSINEYKDNKYIKDLFINEIHSEYKDIRNKFNSFF